MIAKLISGGQSGEVNAALVVAKSLSIPTGGWMPLGWMTEDGPRPEYADLYGMWRLANATYASRTRQNVGDAHATLILADVTDHSELTGGTRLTWGIACQAGKRGAGLFLADLRQPGMVADCRTWLAECTAAQPKGFTLNVAGPRESKSPGIGERARAFLLAVLAPKGGGQ